MRLFVDRYGFLEETWFTFSFSPITDESGDIAGLFHPVTELTGQSLAARRLKVLRDLAAVTGKCTSAQEVVDAAVALFGESNLDLPFVAFYLLDDGGRMARQVARSGLPAETPLCPAEVDLQAPAGQHSAMAEAVRCGEARPVDDVSGRLGGASVGPYPEVPCSAMILPILLPGLAHPAGVIVAGVSARLRMNDEYGDFLNRVAATVASGLANARAHEDERRKAAALAAIDRAKTAFFSNVSHEFRTPLTLMLGPLEDELQEHDPPLTPLRRERIEIAHRNSLRLLKLVNGLLDFSRLEAGRVQALYEPSDLSALTADLASCFRSAVERAGLEFVVECPPLPQPIYVDREMWEKIVLNLLSNALKHTFAGAIRVSTAMQAGAAELTVEDSGVGIAADDIPRLFQRFQRIKGAASRRKR
jgi:GAF domain-containing protein